MAPARVESTDSNFGTHSEQSEDCVASVLCSFVSGCGGKEEKTGIVEVHAGPVKTLQRMRDKLAEYALNTL